MTDSNVRSSVDSLTGKGQMCTVELPSVIAKGLKGWVRENQGFTVDELHENCHVFRDIFSTRFPQ
jgi:hypothetical protein